MVQVGTKYAAKSAPLNELIRQFVDMSFPLDPRGRCPEPRPRGASALKLRAAI
jgi:hypothetical protein